jgi:hypothetical protein
MDALGMVKDKMRCRFRQCFCDPAVIVAILHDAANDALKPLKVYRGRCQALPEAVLRPVNEAMPINVFSPEGGSFHVGDTVTIRWQTTPDFPYDVVRIRLARGNNAGLAEGEQPESLRSVLVIEDEAPNNGRLDWKVTADVSPGPYFKVIVESPDDLLSDQSYPFKIEEKPAALMQEERHSSYMKDKLTRAIPGTRVMLRVAAEAYPSDAQGFSPKPSMRGAFLRYSRFDPPACVLWDVEGGESVNYWVHWKDLDMEPAPAAQQGSQPLSEGGAATSSPGGTTFVAEGEAAALPSPAALLPCPLGKPGRCRKHPKGHHVFISYRRSDGSRLARIIANELEQQGFVPFFDMICLGVGRFEDALRNEIEAAPCFVPVVTENYLRISRTNAHSDMCYAELSMATEFSKPIIPVIQETFKNAFDVMLESGLEIVVRLQNFNSVRENNEYMQGGTIAKLKELIIEGAHKGQTIDPRLEQERLVEPRLSVTSPDGQDAFAEGDTCTIHWEAEGKIPFVNIRLCREVTRGKLRAELIVKPRFSNNRGANTYEWRIPSGLTGDNLHVVVENANDRSIRDASFPFTIIEHRGATRQDENDSKDQLLTDAKGEGVQPVNSESLLQAPLPSPSAAALPQLPPAHLTPASAAGDTSILRLDSFPTTLFSHRGPIISQPTWEAGAEEAERQPAGHCGSQDSLLRTQGGMAPDAGHPRAGAAPERAPYAREVATEEPRSHIYEIALLPQPPRDAIRDGHDAGPSTGGVSDGFFCILERNVNLTELRDALLQQLDMVALPPFRFLRRLGGHLFRVHQTQERLLVMSDFAGAAEPPVHTHVSSRLCSVILPIEWLEPAASATGGVHALAAVTKDVSLLAVASSRSSVEAGDDLEPEQEVTC